MSELIFGKYEVLHRLAVGGMGEVFAARQKGVPGFERWVILKSMLPDLADKPAFVEQFLDEARVAATLNHPNIVTVYEVGLWNGTYYLAMEYIPGRNLAQIRKLAKGAGVSMPWPVALHIVREAALGLDHAHHALDGAQQPLHIVHRDVSPQNIMVRADGIAKVVDFGIARAANRLSRTATGLVKGKLAYMAPEQIRGENVTSASDQFSLGVVLWELLVGRTLFEGATDADILRAVLTHGVPDPVTLVPVLPDGARDVVLRMLRRDPRQRYERLNDVAADLEAVTRGASPTPVTVKAFLDQLEPLTGERATPSAPNFVISLNAEGAEQLGTSDLIVTVDQRSKPRRMRGPVVAASAAAVLIVAVGLGGAAAWTAVEAEPQEPPPAPAAKTVGNPEAVPPAPVPAPLPPEEVSQPTQAERPAPAPAVVKRHPPKAAPAPAPVAAAAAKEPGELSVQSSPWAEVNIDGERVGITPLVRLKVPEGAHTVVLSNPEQGLTRRMTVNIAAGRLTKLDVTLP